tara:strand:+ start:31 stop:381 length:351 start_codon:yes stop_codon:yes gene_type:complete
MKDILGLLTLFAMSFSLQASGCETATSKERFTSIYETVQLKKGDQQKYILITGYARRECITVDQLSNFLELIDEHKIKVSTIQAAYNYLFDVKNIDKLISDFTEQEKKLIRKASKK